MSNTLIYFLKDEIMLFALRKGNSVSTFTEIIFNNYKCYKLLIFPLKLLAVPIYAYERNEIV